jgi:hypothetical protein
MADRRSGRPPPVAADAKQAAIHNSDQLNRPPRPLLDLLGHRQLQIDGKRDG